MSLKWFAKLPLRWVLLIPFVVQIVAAVGLVGFLSWRNGEEAVNDISRQLRHEITARIAQNVHHYLELPHKINQHNANSMQDGNLDFHDPMVLYHYFFKQLKVFTGLFALGFAYQADGSFVSVGRMNERQVIMAAFANENTHHELRTYDVDTQGNLGRINSTTAHYDARERTWYKTLVSSESPRWSKIYPHFVYNTLQISAVQPVYKSNGSLLGSMVVFLRLKELSDFLQSMKVGKKGQTFIMERTGNLVATANQEVLFHGNSDESSRLHASDSNNVMIKGAFHYLKNQFGENLENLKTTQQLDFSYQNTDYFLQVLPYQDERGLDWLITAVIPKSDLMSYIDSNTRLTLFLCIIALCVALIISFGISQWIVHPILELNNAAKNLATGQWQQVINLPAQRNDELGQLAQTFQQMAAELEKLFKVIAADEAKTRQFLEAIPVGIFIVTEKGHPYYANQTAQQILGHGIIPNSKLHDFSSLYNAYLTDTNQFYPLERQPIVRALRGEHSRIDDMELHLVEGQVTPLEVWGAPVFDTQTQICYAVAAFQDISARKQAEADRLRLVEEREAKNIALRFSEEISSKNKELIQVNLEKNEFLGIAAHDLKNPLSAIAGLAEVMLLAEQPNPAEIREYATIIKESSERMFLLITNLLDVNAIESGNLKLSLQAIDIIILLSNLINDYQTRAISKNIYLHFNAEVQACWIYSDKNTFLQIMDNLLSNAVKYSPFGKSIFISVSISESWIRCTVRDEGQGISEPDQQKLFGKFTRLTAKPTGGEHSTGLGLFIVKKLVNALQARVWCESELGMGTTFTVEFPKSHAEPSEPLPVDCGIQQI
ncbi:MAG: ATP-binding protein [Thiotrichaceae bacterium]|nr:ATP-binding protein [Thiotrichaceae bacterium]